MIYPQIVSGTFLLRRNRFIAEVDLGGSTEIVHVKNTGRCRELLVPGTEVFLQYSGAASRKTRYDLVAVKKTRPGKDDLLINMDSQAPNQAVYEWLPGSGAFSPDAVFKREVTYGNSRFDIFVEDGSRRCFIEVKGVTLEENGTAFFPDAPTERGVRHLQELAECVKAGFEAWIFFVVQMKEIRCFRPNDATHPEFGEALRRAAAAGVKIIVMDCIITPDSVTIDSPVKFEL